MLSGPPQTTSKRSARSGYWAGVEAVEGRDEDGGGEARGRRRSARAHVDPLGGARRAEAAELGVVARVGVAGAMVGAVEAEGDPVGGEAFERLDLARVERAALLLLGVEVVARDVRRDRQQVWDPGLGEHRVEAAEGVGPELAGRVEAARVGELVDPHQDARRPGRLGAEGVAAEAQQWLDHASLPAQPPRLRRQCLAEAQRLARGQARRQPAWRFGARRTWCGQRCRAALRRSSLTPA